MHIKRYHLGMGECQCYKMCLQFPSVYRPVILTPRTNFGDQGTERWNQTDIWKRLLVISLHKQGSSSKPYRTGRLWENMVSWPWYQIMESLSTDVFGRVTDGDRTSLYRHCNQCACVDVFWQNCHGREKRLFSVRVVPWDNIQFRNSDLRLASVNKEHLCCSQITL